MSSEIDSLQSLRDNLKYILEYLTKLGPERRSQPLGKNKLEEAKLAYSKLECIVSQINNQIVKSQIDTDDLTIIKTLITEIDLIYDKIKTFICVETVKKTDSPTELKMGSDNKFDLKTAIALLPVMTGHESTTKALIDGIELYSSMIDTESHKQLINFVLKTRLSSSAKLRLKQKYDVVQDLLRDMNKYLIQKQSAVSLQSKLLNTCQGKNRSIESYGSELENLFVNLTIAQSDNDAAKFDILRPINEKVAIKRFADGLENARLSTIIASRTFESLPEAIRCAIDEQNLSSNHQEVMKIRRFNPSTQMHHNYRQNNNRFNLPHTYKRQHTYSHGDMTPAHASREPLRGHDPRRGAARGRAHRFRGTRTYFPRIQHTRYDDMNSMSSWNAAPQASSNTNQSSDINNEPREFFRSQ